MTARIFARPLPEVRVCVLQCDPLRDAFSHIQGVVDGIQRIHLPNTRKWLVNELINTLSDPTGYAPWVTFWAFLLIPKARHYLATLGPKTYPLTNTTPPVGITPGELKPNLYSQFI